MANEHESGPESVRITRHTSSGQVIEVRRVEFSTQTQIAIRKSAEAGRRESSTTRLPHPAKS